MCRARPAGRAAGGPPTGAVTAACLAIKHEIWRALGGVDGARFRIADNEAELCLRACRAGLALLVTPHAALIHDESTTHGSDLDRARRVRWEPKAAALREAWGATLDAYSRLRSLLSRGAAYRTLAAEPPCHGDRQLQALLDSDDAHIEYSIYTGMRENIQERVSRQSSPKPDEAPNRRLTPRRARGSRAWCPIRSNDDSIIMNQCSPPLQEAGTCW